MKFIQALKFFLFIFFISQISFAQWENVAPLPIPDGLQNSYFFNDSTGLISGMGVIYRSEDAFSTFDRIELGIRGKVLDFDFPDQLTGYLILSETEFPYKESKYIFKSTDGGKSWFEIVDTLFYQPKEISFVTRDTGWIATKGGLLYTSNGGTSWEKKSTTYFYHVKFVSKSIGFTSRNGPFFVTTDGGSTWQDRSFQGISVRDIIFKDSLNGILIGCNQFVHIIRTTDGGSNWDIKSTNFNYDYSFPSFYKDATIIVYRTGEGGIRSDDGGNNWNYFELDYAHKSGGKALLKDYYYHYGFAGLLHRSTNRGINWENIGSRYGGGKLQFVNSLYGLTAPSYFTSDGGLTWHIKTVNLPDSNLLYSDFWYFTPDIGLYASGRTLFKTNNGGLSWDTLYMIPPPEYKIKKLFFLDQNTGWLLIGKEDGYENYIQGVRHTTDGGTTWSEFYESGRNSSYMVFLNKTRGFLFGLSDDNSYGGYRTTDGGLTWEYNNFASSSSVSFIDSMNGFAVRYAGEMIKTTDGGDSFSIINISENIWQLIFIDSLHGYRNGIGDDGYLIEGSSDGGKTWKVEHIDEHHFYRFFTSDNNVFAVSSEGRIARRSAIITGITTSPSETIPDEYSLSTNYPNPFNPSTTINYSIPEDGLVSLTLYDALGRKIATLVNEKKTAGSYNVDFNAEGLASGMYFYQLQAGKFVQTKKMILLR